MSTPHDPALHLIPAPGGGVGAAGDGVTGGVTAAWVARVSLGPPRVAVSVAPERFTHGLIDASGFFTLSILKPDQVDVGRLFGLRSRRDVDKWAETAHVLLEGEAPALERCAARISCRVVDRLTTGDHELFVGEILGSETVDGGPALPMRGKDWAP